MPHAGGRPPMYSNVDDMQILIDKYFTECKGEILIDADGVPMLNKYDQPIYLNSRPLTVTGLALALGFNSRQALLNYQGRKEFNDAIMRAKTVIEEYTASRLFDKEGCNGAKFSLINNYGWADKTENVNMNTDLTDLDEDERAARIAELLNSR